MELSNYQAFMECMRKWEKIGCNILCGLALWEQMQDCDRRGVPYTDIDIEAVSQDVAYRLMMSHDRLYALALYEWTEQHFAQNDDTSNAAAGENGCDFPTHINSSCVQVWRRKRPCSAISIIPHSGRDLLWNISASYYAGSCIDRPDCIYSSLLLTASGVGMVLCDVSNQLSHFCKARALISIGRYLYGKQKI